MDKHPKKVALAYVVLAVALPLMVGLGIGGGPTRWCSRIGDLARFSGGMLATIGAALVAIAILWHGICAFARRRRLVSVVALSFILALEAAYVAFISENALNTFVYGNFNCDHAVFFTTASFIAIVICVALVLWVVIKSFNAKNHETITDSWPRLSMATIGIALAAFVIGLRTQPPTDMSFDCKLEGSGRWMHFDVEGNGVRLYSEASGWGLEGQWWASLFGLTYKSSSEYFTDRPPQQGEGDRVSREWFSMGVDTHQFPSGRLIVFGKHIHYLSMRPDYVEWFVIDRLNGKFEWCNLEGHPSAGDQRCGHDYRYYDVPEELFKSIINNWYELKPFERGLCMESAPIKPTNLDRQSTHS